MDTYDKRCQLGASRRRLEDAQALHSHKRWTGAIYLGGYAIECSLKSLICYKEGNKSNFKDTRIFKKKLQGVSLHNLTFLLESVPTVQRTIELDRTGIYKEAWKVFSSLWRNDELRYSDKSGEEKDSEIFLQSVQILHKFILDKQGETS